GEESCAPFLAAFQICSCCFARVLLSGDSILLANYQTAASGQRRLRRKSRELPRNETKSAQVSKPSVESVPGAAKHIADLMPDQLLYLFTRRTEILARIELLGIFGKNCSQSGGHGQAQVGVDIDLGAAHATRDFDIGFWDAGSSRIH